MIGTARFDNSMILQVMYTPSHTQYMYTHSHTSSTTHSDRMNVLCGEEVAPLRVHFKVDDHVPLALLAKEVLELFVGGIVHTGGDGEERLRGVVGAVGTGLHPSPYHRVEEVATPPHVAARMGDKL